MKPFRIGRFFGFLAELAEVGELQCDACRRCLGLRRGRLTFRRLLLLDEFKPSLVDQGADVTVVNPVFAGICNRAWYTYRIRA